MEHAVDSSGTEHYAKLYAECVDKFLVAAFIDATEHFVFDQAGVDRDEDSLSKKRIKEIMRLVKSARYDGDF
jgi:lipoate-protein ligase A